MNCVSFQSGFCFSPISGLDVPTVEHCERCAYRVSIPQPEQRERGAEEPVGTVLREKILKIAPVRERKSCGCEQLAAEMDAWGIAGCELRREHIVTRMVANRKMLERGLIEGGRWWQSRFAELAPDAMLKAGARWLLNEAIADVQERYKRRAEQRGVIAAIVSPTIVDRNRFAGRCVAVTSLSPNPMRAQRQARCVKSWRDIGLEVLAVNTADEHNRLCDEIRQHVTPVINNEVASEYAKPMQRIQTLLRVGASKGHPFIVINADIETAGPHEPIERALAMPEALTIGIRFNYMAGHPLEWSQREPHGLDAFILTPQLACTLPDMPFAMGQPVWDYWLPHHFHSRGTTLNWIYEPLLFHERHEIQWSVSDWHRGGKWLEQEYGLPAGAVEAMRVTQWQTE